MEPLRPGSICARPGDRRLHLLLEKRDDGFLAIRYPVQSTEIVELPAAGLEPRGADDASLRVLQMRRATAFAATRSAPGRPVRTAMVLCAGLGTRLRPLTLRYPKPALPFFGGPLIRYSFALLKTAGVERVVINTHHLPEVMAETAGREAKAVGLELFVSHEPVVQGTGGGVRDARRFIGDEPFVLLNGDAFMSLDLRALIGVHQSRGDAATMAVVPMPPGESFAAVEATSEGDVRRIAGKGEPGEGLVPWHFVGAHVIEPALFDFIPPQNEQDINRTVYLAMLRAGLKVRVCPVALGAWADLGTPRRYLQACEELLTGLCDLEPLGRWAPLSRDQSRELRAGEHRRWISPSARVEGEIEGWAVVSEEARVEGVRLKRCAVLPGTHVPASERELADVIASGELRLCGG